ncbi:hypothetical protein [Pseudotenacibaculum haliotis]|uniref:Secreted protein n=1 Tax=Pseudotenacibaculum haliotis TaxID=1862138 RepID=A0ABW5LWV6_9FLAO
MKKIVLVLFAMMAISTVNAQLTEVINDDCDEVVTDLKGEIFIGNQLGMAWTFDTGGVCTQCGPPAFVEYRVEIETGYMDATGNMVWGATQSHTVYESDTVARPNFAAYVGQRTSYARFRVKIVNDEDCNPWTDWKVVSVA